MNETAIKHPFVVGAKVARISYDGYGRGTGSIERSVVTSLIEKGKRAGRFRVQDFEGDHEADFANGRWGAKSSGWFRGSVYLDDDYVAEVEAEFQFAASKNEMDRVRNQIDQKINDAIRSATPADQQKIIEQLQSILALLSEPAK